MEELAKKDVEVRIQTFWDWMQVNGASLTGCYLKPSARALDAGLGLYSSGHCFGDKVIMVTPLVLAVTPMTVLQDPLVGPIFGKLFADGQVDDRHVIILYLVVQRALGDSSFWEPYLKLLPTKFGTSVFFSEDEMLELTGTSLYNATRIQKASLAKQFTEKVKPIVNTILASVECPTRDVVLEDFLWANFIFWTRALTIPCPHSLIYPQTVPVPVSLLQRKKQETPDKTVDMDKQALDSEPLNRAEYEQLLVSSSPELLEKDKAVQGGEDDKAQSGLTVLLSDSGLSISKVDDDIYKHGLEPAVEIRTSEHGEVHPPQMVEGLVPGIDFCNHAIQGEALARWEVDGSNGPVTGVPNSMYLVTGPEAVISPDNEITIHYGSKSNEELLYLYGFVLDNNPDEYLMVHFPVQALERGECPEAKSQLLEHLELPLRWLLSLSILEGGYLSEHRNEDSTTSKFTTKEKPNLTRGYSWSGHRKPPPDVTYQVFPEDMMGALRILAMTEKELLGVQNLLEELAESSQRLPSAEDIKAAVWEGCGDIGALQLLQDLITSRVMALEEGTGPEDADSVLLENDSLAKVEADKKHQQGRAYKGDDEFIVKNRLSKNKRACVAYRKGQKHLARQFLQEVEYALDRWIR